MILLMVNHCSYLADGIQADEKEEKERRKS